MQDDQAAAGEAGARGARVGRERSGTEANAKGGSDSQEPARSKGKVGGRTTLVTLALTPCPHWQTEQVRVSRGAVRR